MSNQSKGYGLLTIHSFELLMQWTIYMLVFRLLVTNDREIQSPFPHPPLSVFTDVEHSLTFEPILITECPIFLILLTKRYIFQHKDIPSYLVNTY